MLLTAIQFLFKRNFQFDKFKTFQDLWCESKCFILMGGHSHTHLSLNRSVKYDAVMCNWITGTWHSPYAGAAGRHENRGKSDSSCAWSEEPDARSWQSSWDLYSKNGTGKGFFSKLFIFPYLFAFYQCSGGHWALWILQFRGTKSHSIPRVQNIIQERSPKRVTIMK